LKLERNNRISPLEGTKWRPRVSPKAATIVTNCDLFQKRWTARWTRRKLASWTPRVRFWHGLKYASESSSWKSYLAICSSFES
jgi:hypothetical protein